MFTEAQIAQWRNDIYQLLDQPQPFYEWLKAHKNRVVGQSWAVDNCPIYRFLYNQAPWLDAAVGVHHIDCNLTTKLCRKHGWLSPNHAWNENSFLEYYGSNTKSVPEWVGRFITAFDREFTLYLPAVRLWDRQAETQRYNSYATGQDALKVLVEVVPERLAAG